MKLLDAILGTGHADPSLAAPFANAGAKPANIEND